MNNIFLALLLSRYLYSSTFKSFSNLIKRGLSLEEVIERQRKRLGIKKAKILPMTNDKVETYIFSEGKKIHLSLLHNLYKKFFHNYTYI